MWRGMSTVNTKNERQQRAVAPTWVGPAVAVAGHAAIAAWVVRAGLGTGAIIGIPWGEQWGRLFVAAQVGRWLRGTPPGWADLLAAPHGRPFWPVDPLVQAVEVPASALAGEATGWALTLGLLSFVAGLGGTTLARRFGADWPRAAVAGLLVQLNPFWLREGAEGVTEVLAVGLLALAAAAAHRAVVAPSRRSILVFAAAWAAVCWTSPYSALYGFGAAILMSWAFERRAAAVVLGTALIVGILAASPLVLAESGDRGRLTATWTGGYRLVPDQLVRIQRDAAGTVTLQPTKPPPFGLDAGSQGRSRISPVARFLVPWPGGFPVAALLLLGLTRPQTRRAAAFGLVFFLIGPAWGPIVRAIGLPELPSPLEAALSRLPVTSLLGNVNRSVVVPLLVAAGVAGSDRNRLGTLVLAAAVVTAALVEVPTLSLPATEVHPPVRLYAAIEGPTAVFPSGDPPVWNPGPWPKENLWHAGHHGGAQGYDYGRGGDPADVDLQVRLSEVGGVALGRGAAEKHRASDADIWRGLREARFARVLVLRRTLEDPAWEEIHAWLTAELGAPIAMDGDGGVWAIGEENR